MTRESFREHLEALDNVDVDALTTRFYHRDVSTEMGGETLDLAGLLDLREVADVRCGASLRTAGDRWEIHLNVFYTLRDGRISHIEPNVISVQQAE